MINLKKIDEKDIVFVKPNFTEKEDLLFSKFLKLRNKPKKMIRNTTANMVLPKAGLKEF